MRWALYFTPGAEAPLTRAAAAWLGRDAFGGAALPVPGIGGLDAGVMKDLTAEPRRYGFHATLVAPFRPREGVREADILDCAARFAASRPAFEVPRLAVSRLDGFIALVPHPACAALDSLAADAVEAFNALRAPLSEVEILRRRPERLTPRQRAYLDAFGYPYVKEEFRFHMTLTGALDAGTADRLEPALAERFAPLLADPVPVSAVALFQEPVPGAPFIVHSLHRLGPAEARSNA